ncbi:MAG: hypothetical protein LKI53_08690 [Bacteroidales bacterium]|jgi:multimeric flavodoxin WrbA|nr:hypothetical protein [Bacteroidales bacterium]
MKLIIHDFRGEDANIPELSASENTRVISDNGKIKPCIGCFGCWLKTPGECINKSDGYNNIGRLFGNCSEMLVISECRYGAYSPFVKNVFDRCIGCILPFFEIINGEMHHKKRYGNEIKIKIMLYGDITGEERQTASNILRRNFVNLHVTNHEILFFKNKEDLKGALL